MSRMEKVFEPITLKFRTVYNPVGCSMKKLLSGVLLIGVVSGVAVFASNAFFSDTEISSGNKLEAGKLDLKVDYSSTYNGVASNSWELTDLTDEKFFDLADVKPGDSGEGTISLHVDDNNAWGCVTIKPTANDDNGLTEPESEVDTTDGVGNGELAQNLQFKIWADTCVVDTATPGDNIYQAGCDTLLVEGPAPLSKVTWPLADSTHPNVFTGSGALLGNATYYIGAGWDLPNAVGNEVQTDNYKADISFYTEQERNNGNFVCSTPTVFFDDFNDGNFDGWWINHSVADHIDDGNWRIENGSPVEDAGHDGELAMIENQQFSSQTDEMKVKTFGPGGGVGFTIWHQDDVNWTMVVIDPGHGWIRAGTQVSGVSYGYQYPLASLEHDTWYNLKIEADSVSGDLKVFLDGNYLFTHTMETPNRIGLSGVSAGNAGGSFDDFKLTSN